MTEYFFRSEYFHNFRLERPYTFDCEQMFMWNVLLLSKDRSLFIKRPYVFESDQELFCKLSKDRILCGSFRVLYESDLILLKKTVYFQKSPDFNYSLSMFIIFGAFEFVDLRLRRNSLV